MEHAIHYKILSRIDAIKFDAAAIGQPSGKSAATVPAGLVMAGWSLCYDLLEFKYVSVCGMHTQLRSNGTLIFLLTDECEDKQRTTVLK